MRTHQGTIILLLSALAAHASAAQADAGDYVIHDRMEILKPVDLGAMNNESQSAELVQDLGASVVVDVTYHPLRGPQPVSEDPDWRVHDQALADYLSPGITANWDDSLRADVLSGLAQAGVTDPLSLTDRQLVERVSKWLLTFGGDAPFIAYDADFVDGAPVVRPEMRKLFDAEKARFGLGSDEDTFNHWLFGKGLFYAHIHGSCTPSAILWSTVFRSLGIPTRLVVTVPPVDANDRAQLLSLVNGVRHNAVRATLISGVGVAAGSHAAWAQHSFVEVYVGGRWTRLNYDNLGQAILDPVYFGLLTVVNRYGDFSESGLTDTWGLHQAAIGSGEPFSPALSSVNPYRSLAISDNLDELPGLSNPGVPGAPDPLSVTVDHAWVEGDPGLPAALQGKHEDSVRTFFLNLAEKTSADPERNGWMKYLYSALAPGLVLSAGSERIRLDSYQTETYEATPSSPFQGFVLRVPEDQAAALKSGTLYQVSFDYEPNAHFAIQAAPGLTLRAP